MSAWVGQDQRGPLGGGGPCNTGRLRRNQLKSLQVETAQGRTVLPTSQLPPLSPAPLTVDGHPVDPAGLAHLIAHHALKLG